MSPRDITLFDTSPSTSHASFFSPPCFFTAKHHRKAHGITPARSARTERRHHHHAFRPPAQFCPPARHRFVAAPAVDDKRHLQQRFRLPSLMPDVVSTRDSYADSARSPPRSMLMTPCRDAAAVERQPIRR